MQDLGWSYDSSILVSVGLDSRVVVWSGYTFEKLKTLSQHGSHVKGITFDPANKYFATASDDRSVRIFRYTSPLPNSTAYDQTNNFMLETTITAPFAGSPLTTYFRRCSWSPDGNHIAAANAVNGPVSTAVIINRGQWDGEINLVGHEGPVEVCAFSPRIFNATPPSQFELSDPARALTTSVLACAGQDRSLTIWVTINSKPLFVTEGLCEKSISDLAWTPDGERLFLTSLDGTIALASFQKGDLGYPMPLEANESCLARYGAGRKVGIIEGPQGLLLEERSKDDELRNVEGRMGELMGDAPGANSKGPSKLANGIATTNGVIGNKAPATIATAGDAQSTDEAQTSKEPQHHTEDANAAKVEKLKQRVTITKDGRKRVTPMLVSSAAGTTESSLPRSQLMTTQSQAARSDAPQHVLDVSKPYDGLPRGGLATLLFGNKRKLAETGSEDDSVIAQRVAATQREEATTILINTPDGLAVPDVGAVSRPSLVNPSLTVSQIRLAVPLIRSHIIRHLNGNTKSTEQPSEANRSITGSDDVHVMEVRNPTGPSRTGRPQDREPARITVLKRGQLLWQDFLPKAVSLVTGNSRFWAAASEDGSLHTWTPAGRRLFNAFAIEAQPVILDSRGPWLLCISAVGLCHVWNVVQSSSPHPPVSLAPVLDLAAHSQGPHLTNGPAIIFARLNSVGRVVVAMSNGDAYAYSPAMYVWQRMSEPWWAVGSQYWNSKDSGSTASSGRPSDDEHDDEVRPENISAGIIPMLERNTTNQTLTRGRAYFLQRLVKSLLSAEGYEGFESGVSVAHLENRLAAALTLRAKDEFKVYLNMYAKRLGAEGSRLKIEELLRSLLNGIYDENNENSAPGPLTFSDQKMDELCGWKKETLLKEVILILGMWQLSASVMLDTNAYPYDRQIP